MLEATLKRALEAVRQKLAEIDESLADWMAERERRRRTQALILKGIIRSRGSQRQAALATGLSSRTIARILDHEGHRKHREKQAERDARKRNLAAPEPDDENEESMPTNVVKLRRRQRPDWHPKEPQRREVRKWYQQYLGWDAASQATARQLVFNTEKGRLPDAAYYDDNGPGSSSDGGRTVGSQKRHATASD